MLVEDQTPPLGAGPQKLNLVAGPEGHSLRTDHVAQHHAEGVVRRGFVEDKALEVGVRCLVLAILSVGKPHQRVRLHDKVNSGICAMRTEVLGEDR